jgi:enterochelin esterase-like enzyme
MRCVKSSGAIWKGHSSFTGGHEISTRSHRNPRRTTACVCIDTDSHGVTERTIRSHQGARASVERGHALATLYLVRVPDEEWRSAVAGAEVVFRLADPERTLSAVRLSKDRSIPGGTEFARVDGGWALRIPRPPVHRLEYKLELRDAADVETSTTDPSNPLTVGGPFGDRSWLALPGYVAPDWIEVEPVPSAVVPVPVPATPVGDVDVHVWTPTDAAPTESLPLLVSHDGPEFAAYARLTQYAGAMIARGDLPRFRLALVKPGVRNEWYAANSHYATALVRHVLPAVGKAFASEQAPVLMGTSLGALSALHAEWTHPGTFAGLFLQSGSFFTKQHDPQESGFSHFAQVTGFVATVLDSAECSSRPLVAMTCGSHEENAHNNRGMVAHLMALGLDVRYDESLDMHNFTAWRDVLDPGLTTLLQRVWEHRDGSRTG